MYSANLSPAFGTEPGKTRPVVVIQTDLINNAHPSTIICPITTRIITGNKILRIMLNQKSNNLTKPSQIIVDQIRAIDNQRFVKEIGRLSASQSAKLIESMRILLIEI